MLSGLVALENDGASLDRDELVAMIHLLLIAGQETTVDLISNGVLAMLTNPDQWHALTAEPSLASAVVEEVLRYDGPVEIVPPRIALRELEFAGGIIPAFETVALSVYGANHDPDVFAEPASFDIHRPDVAQHLAFGHGAHFCLGARLARLEGRIMFEQLALRFPKLQLAGDPADRRGDEPRVTSLPLRLE